MIRTKPLILQESEYQMIVGCQLVSYVVILKNSSYLAAVSVAEVFLQELEYSNQQLIQTGASYSVMEKFMEMSLIQ